MPFKHYIQRIEGKVAEAPTSVKNLVRYKNYRGCYRYGVRVEGIQSDVWEEGHKVWAWWADTPEEAIRLYHRGVEEDMLHPFGRGTLTWTDSGIVEEYHHAV